MPPSSPFLLILLVLLFHHSTSLPSSGPHVADVNILLPPKMTHPVEYRLQASDGCFKWSWDHHDILSVLPEYNSSSHCSMSARLKSIAPYGGRKETAVYATDLNTGMMIRCMVYIDAVKRIQIFHNSIKLDLDGLATLRVRAFDSEDNVFSSLVGLQFMWQLNPETDGLPHHLIHVPLEDSPLSDCGGLCGDLDIQEKLEKSGVFSDLFVVKGTEIGHEVVSVNLLEPSFEHLADKIVLTVAEAMALEPPSPVYVLIGAVIQYTLKVIRSNSPHAVRLPSPFHHWSSLNSSVAEVDRAMGVVNSLNIGQTSVLVEDTRVVGHTQISSLHVTVPDNLLLYLSPLFLSGDLREDVDPIPSASRWYVVAGRRYLIHIKVFTKGPGAQVIFITGSDELELHDDQDEFWNILPVSEDKIAKGNHRILDANTYGLGKVTASLAYRTGPDVNKEVLKVFQEVMVCDQVNLNMKGDTNFSETILLPWVPGVYQELQLEAIGGCAMSSSDYKWFSSDMTVVSVSVSGIVQAKKPGKTTIKAVSIFDSLNYDEVIIEVSVPSSMVMLPNFPVEIPVGSHLHASVTLKSSTGACFYACDAFMSSVKWEADSESFFIVNATDRMLVSDNLQLYGLHSSSYGPPCAWTRLYASSSGRSSVHATLIREFQQYDQTISGSAVLKASASIAAYLPLIVHQVSDGNHFGGYWFDFAHAESQSELSNLEYLYLAPGTYMDVMLRGGPERWGKDVEFVESVDVLDGNISHVKDEVLTDQMLTSYGNTYRISCRGVGTFKIVFRRGNLVGEDHQLPSISEVQLSLKCSFPSSIAIIADEAFNTLPVVLQAAQVPRLASGIRASQIKVANGRRIRISAVGLSHSGKAFANSSSLRLMWELAECKGLAVWDDAYSSKAYSTWERFLILQNSSGLCIVQSTIGGFVDSLSHLNFVKMFGASTNSLIDAVQLQLVSSLRLDPEFSLLFFSPDARLNISITGGSYSLETVVNDTNVVEVLEQVPACEGKQLMLAPINLGTALVTVHDVGLVPPLAASTKVQVAEVDWIKILTGEHISIMEGSFETINFLTGVDDGRTFDSSQYIYMKIYVHFEENMLKIVETYDFPVIADRYIHAPNFTIQAMRLGVTTIYLSSIRHSGHQITSQPVEVEVYAPPKIHPPYLFLVPGASYVVTTRGGPKFNSHIQYACTDDHIAKIDKFSGRLSAISPGNCTIIAAIYGDGNTMLCQAYGKFEVGIPSSAVLSVQSERLAVGRRMPIHPSLSEGNLFSFYEICDNVEWSVGNKYVLDFQDTNQVHGTGHSSTAELFQPVGPSSAQVFNFIQVLRGMSAGETNVTISFSCNFKGPKSYSKSMTYRAFISLWVISELPLSLGSPITWILPPYYTSSDLLPSSPHSHFKADALGDKGIDYSLLGQVKRNVEEELDDAVYVDGAKIITRSPGNLACVQAKDRSTKRTEIASCLRVAEVVQIRIMTNEYPIHVLAAESELELPIIYHDALGNPFHEAYNVTLFEVETNHPDVVSIDEYDNHGSIRMQGKKQGLALVRIYFISNPHKSVYAVVHVGPHLYPQNPVIYQGNNLNFSIKGLRDSASGQWFSTNESVLYIDRISGKAEAVGEGTTDVYYKGSNFKHHTTVSVLKGSILSIEAPRQLLTNVPFPSKGYAFSVRFSYAGNHRGDASGNKDLLLFQCSVEPPSIGFAQPSKDVNTGERNCLFFPYPPEHLAPSSFNSETSSSRQVTVSVTASLGGERWLSGSASSFFIGGFSILEMNNKNSWHLNLTGDLNKKVITIVGNADVEIDWNNKDHLSLRPIRESDMNQLQYEVSAHGRKKFGDKLIVSLPATGQRVEIDVSYDPEEEKATESSANINLWAVVSGLLLVILTMTFVICYLDRPNRPSPPSASNGPSFSAPVTPERSNPSVIPNQSPRTPSPFIDYVRRTIDETPYYRRDFRRRGDPQNTY